ncbi:hypothetical protein CKALI_11345 [Corynebacterium kalinowskii]|uniref:DNA primase n=1 Tax=Corynebacterium kalinowskii TaxID=2675216 RepID=A0A6B8VG50_9CORY|nr:hypothetical protein [Corynebacterium kalinowskii]QGU03113.1 hypothetical protein CKALI_11345 [Corynebacterium kalinowskii]
MSSCCEQCGERLEIKVSGPSARYCSGKCRQRAYRRRCKQQLPARMRQLDRWTVADGKRPVTACGAPASSTDASTWGSYEQVSSRPHGIMLGGGIACIDLDHCINGRGQLAPWASEIINAAPGAVVERSMSGRGLHVFGLLPEAPGRRRGHAEVYSRARFIRTTENIYRPGRLVDLEPAVKKLNALARAGDIPT